MKLTVKKYVNKKNIIIVVVLLAVLACTAYFVPYFKSKNFEKENQDILNGMIASQVKDGIDPSRLLEIQENIRLDRHKEAQDQIYKILKEPNLLDKDKRALYTQLAKICIPLRDFACVDKLSAEFGKLIEYDYYLLVDAAHLALLSNQPDKAKQYYAIALAELDKQGGETFVNKINGEVQVTLDYQEIKKGAQ